MKRTNVKANRPNKKLKYSNDDLENELNSVSNGMAFVRTTKTY